MSHPCFRYVTIWMLGLFMVSCHDDVYELPVTVDYQLLNQDFRESSTFQQGDNILFRLSITNHTLDEVSFYQKEIDDRYLCRVFTLDSVINLIDFGRPYLDVFCGHEPIIIEPKVTFITTIPWYPPIPYSRDSLYFNPYICSINKDVPELTAGNYQTHFSSSFRFTFDQHTWRTTESFSIEFEVQ